MTRYTVLFAIDIWHDYDLNRGDIIHEALSPEQQMQVMVHYASKRLLSITPTATTMRTLAGQQMLFKSTTTGFLVAVKLDAQATDSQPLVPLTADFQLTFALQIVEPYFFNYTALNTDSLGFYWFSNGSGNGQFLSVPVPPFDPHRPYRADDLYSEPSGDSINLFRALQDTGPAAPLTMPINDHWLRIPPDTFDANAAYPEGAIVLAHNQLYRAVQALEAGSNLDDPSQWEPFSTLANQYVTAADSLPLRPPFFELDLSAVPLTRATIRLFRGDSSTVAWEKLFEAPDGELETVPLALSNLPPDRYRLEVLNQALMPVSELGFEFYLDGEVVCDRWFGVIRIGLGSGEMALLDDQGNLRSPHYRLRFLNRASRWRYRFPREQAIGVGADVVPADPNNQQVLVTPQPLPLTRYGRGIRLQADATDTTTVSEEVLLPEPNVQRIQRQNAQWYSDIYLSNLSI